MRCQQQVLEYFPKEIWDFILPQTGLLRSMLRPSDLGPGGRSYNGPISHLHHQVLSTLQEWGLFLKPEKCKFKQKEVKYLGLVILKDHIAMDLTKVHRVTEWLTPTKVKEVQSFLGFVNFYWKFICNFSNIACPLYALTCKTQWWVWGSPKQEVFDALK